MSYLTEETPEEKALAEYIFQHDIIPWWVPIGGELPPLILCAHPAERYWAQ